jgi:hypothetical protein
MKARETNRLWPRLNAVLSVLLVLTVSLAQNFSNRSIEHQRHRVEILAVSGGSPAVQANRSSSRLDETRHRVAVDSRFVLVSADGPTVPAGRFIATSEPSCLQSADSGSIQTGRSPPTPVS